jgi:hypothetical protein
MTDEKRAADDAKERLWLLCDDNISRDEFEREWKAALSARADGGKGEARYQIRAENANWCDATESVYNSWPPHARRIAPQAECAPREEKKS